MTGGDDKTMWCRSIASGAVDLNQEIPDWVWMWLVPPQQAPDKPTEVAIEFPWSLRSAELLDWSETVFADDEIVTTRHRTVHVAMPRDDGAIVRVHPLFAP